MRYFIRRSGEADGSEHRHEGGLASFMTTIGRGRHGSGLD